MSNPFWELKQLCLANPLLKEGQQQPLIDALENCADDVEAAFFELLEPAVQAAVSRISLHLVATTVPLPTNETIEHALTNNEYDTELTMALFVDGANVDDSFE